MSTNKNKNKNKNSTGKKPTIPLCDCYSKLMNRNHCFNHYNEKNDFLGSVFDDFGSETFVDENGEKHQFFIHRHLGTVHSFHHYILNAPPKTWKCIQDEKNYPYDNSVIPAIRELISKELISKA